MIPRERTGISPSEQAFCPTCGAQVITLPLVYLVDDGPVIISVDVDPSDDDDSRWVIHRKPDGNDYLTPFNKELHGPDHPRHRNHLLTCPGPTDE